MTYERGQLVKYSKPEAGEECMTFVVIEDRGDRLLVGLVGAQGFGSQECFAKSHYEAA